MRLLTHTLILQVAFWFIILLYLLVLNRETETIIPLSHIGAISCIYLAYNLTISYIFLKMGELSWISILYVLVYVVLVYTLFSVVSFIVHDFFPEIGIQLFDATKPFNEVHFRVRLIRGFFIINIIAAFIVFIVRMIAYKKRKRISEQKSAQKLQQYQLMIAKNEWKSHFLNTIFSVSFGRRLIDDTPKKQTEIFDIIQFLDYQFKVHFPLVEWEEELDQLDCFIRLIRYQYGKRSVILYNNVREKIGFQVPHAALLFPLENCLKHGQFSERYPIFYQFKNTADGIEVSCTNKIGTEGNHIQVERLGRGIGMLKAQLELASFPITYHTISDDFYFTLLINFKYSSNEEGNL